MKCWFSAVCLFVAVSILGTVLSTRGTADARNNAARQRAISAPTIVRSAALPEAQVTLIPVDEASPETIAVASTDMSAGPLTPGYLFMIDHSPYPEHKLVQFDLATQQVTTRFTVPQDGWIYQFDMAEANGQIALAYGAPPNSDPTNSDPTNSDQNQAAPRQPYDRSGIYLLALDDPTADPVLLFGADTAHEYYFNPIWSPDGASIYYVLYRRLDNSQTGSQASTPDVALYRYDLASAEHIFIAQDGVWPRLSPDGKRLVYIQVDPVTKARGIHIIETGKIAPDREALNAEDVTIVVAIDAFFDVDTPHFAPDGQWLYFTAIPHSTKVSQAWWETLLGVKVAHAHTDHNAPADWWRVSVNGGEPERITSVPRMISHGEFDESGQRLFFATDIGIFTMAADGTTIKRLPLPNLYRFVVWTE